MNYPLMIYERFFVVRRGREAGKNWYLRGGGGCTERRASNLMGGDGVWGAQEMRMDIEDLSRPKVNARVLMY